MANTITAVRALEIARELFPWVYCIARDEDGNNSGFNRIPLFNGTAWRPGGERVSLGRNVSWPQEDARECCLTATEVERIQSIAGDHLPNRRLVMLGIASAAQEKHLLEKMLVAIDAHQSYAFLPESEVAS